jgi:hypothetical protein
MLLTRSTTGVVVADDSNHTSISYEGSWCSTDKAESFNRTEHRTDIAGSTATFTFTGMPHYLLSWRLLLFTIYSFIRYFCRRIWYNSWRLVISSSQVYLYHRRFTPNPFQSVNGKIGRPPPANFVSIPNPTGPGTLPGCNSDQQRYLFMARLFPISTLPGTITIATATTSTSYSSCSDN